MAVFNLKFEQRLYHRIRCPRDGDEIENSEDPDQTALQEQSDLGLHCFLPDKAV